MRLTESMRLASATSAEARAADQLYRATRRASSGLKVEMPSDGPAAYSAIAAYDGAITRLGKRAEIVGRAADVLNLADGSLASAADVVSHARELALEMSNGHIDAATRARAATEVTALREEVLKLANTKAPDRYLFAGTADATPPFTAAGAFVGNDHAIEAETSDGVLVRVNASGAKAFTAAGGRDVLADLANLATALGANNVAGIEQSLTDLDAAHGQIIAARSEIGVTVARLRSASDMTTAILTTLRGARAGEAEADPLEAFSTLTIAKSSYERSIQVTAQILAVSSINRG